MSWCIREMPQSIFLLDVTNLSIAKKKVVHYQYEGGWVRKDVVYLVSSGRPADISLQLGKACCPCSR